MIYKKKILIIHHSGAIGGAGVSLLHILESMKNLNLDVSVYCPTTPNYMAREISELGYEVLSDPKKIPIINHYSGSSMLFFDYRALINIVAIMRSKKRIKELIAKVNPDAVIVNSMTLSYIGEIAQSMDIESICFHRETYTKGFLGLRTKIIKYQLSHHFDKVVFISKYDSIQSGKMKSSTFVITDKVKLNDYEEEYLNSNSGSLRDNSVTNLLYVGGMSKLKGALILIKALSICKDDIHLTFLQYNEAKKKKQISDCKSLREKIRFLFGKDYTARVLNIINKNKMWHRIHFISKTTDVAPFFRNCDIVVFPSISPHQARPIYEAGAAKKPIIITKSHNIEEFVKHEKNGLTFKTGDYNELALAINRLATNSLLRKELGEENYTRTINNHDFTMLENELRKVLDI